MNLVIDFGNKGVFIETVTNIRKDIDMTQIDKIKRPVYVVKASEVFKGEYFLLRRINSELTLVLDRNLQFNIVTRKEAENCVTEYSYTYIEDKAKQYTTNVAAINSRFNSKVGHIEILHGADNCYMGKEKHYTSYSGELVDNKRIKGLFESNISYARLFFRYRGKTVRIGINAIYNYNNLSLDYKHEAILLGAYCRKFDFSQLDANTLKKILTDNTDYMQNAPNHGTSYIGLEYNEQSSYIDNTITSADVEKLKNEKKAYLWSRKLSNFDKGIAFVRVITKERICYRVKGYNLDNGLMPLEEIIESNGEGLANVRIENGYIDILGLDGHYRYNIAEYYSYYKLERAENTDIYHMQKLINEHTTEEIRQNGVLSQLKYNTIRVEIPRNCKKILSKSIEITERNKIIVVPSSVRECSKSPIKYEYSLRSTHMGIAEITVENNIDGVLNKFLSSIARIGNSTNGLVVNVDRLTLKDMYVLFIYFKNTQINLSTQRKLKVTEKQMKDFYVSEYDINRMTYQERRDKINELKFFQGLIDENSPANFDALIDKI